MTVENPTVVDEFFSALFSHHNPDKNSSQATSNKKRSLDEFDECSMFSKRKLGDPSSSMVGLKKSKDTQGEACFGSKMLIRNMSAAVNRRDIRDRFSKFGKITDIVFKNSFAFVQFESIEACNSAIKNEQGNLLKGSLLELEVCRFKPCLSNEIDKTKNDRSKIDRKKSERSKVDKSKLTKILVRNNVSQSFVSTVSDDLKKGGVLVDTVYVKNPKSERDLIKTLVKDGIRTVVTIDRNLEQDERVCLQVFSSENNGKSASFDQYDSILSEEAVEIILQFTRQNSLKSDKPCEAASLLTKVPDPVIRNTHAPMKTKSSGFTTAFFGQSEPTYHKPPQALSTPSYPIRVPMIYPQAVSNTGYKPSYGSANRGSASTQGSYTSSYLTVPTTYHPTPNPSVSPQLGSFSAAAEPNAFNDVVSLLSSPQHQLAVSRLLSTIISGLRTPSPASNNPPAHLSPLPNTVNAPAFIQNVANVRPW